MKTAASVLQEMMVKMGQVAEYECISQSGPQHQALFEYRCLANGEVVTAVARSKKKAKQEVARVMLQRLAAKSYPVPPPYGIVPGVKSTDDEVITAIPSDTRSYVALLKELCQEYRLPPVDYELVSDTGPPHLRRFTVRARLGHYERLVTSTTKKAARQLAAEKLYTFLRKSLARLTQDFDEDAALARAHVKAMDRYQEPDGEENLRRPDLGQRVSDYPLGLTARLDPKIAKRAAALLKATKPRKDHSPERIMREVAEVMNLELSHKKLERKQGGPLILLDIACTSPELCFDGDTATAAAAAALNYFHIAFRLANLL